MKKEVRLADIANRLQVSTVTVSNALAGQKGVSEELRERIKQTAAQMGYQSRAAAAASGKKILTIGVIISEQYLGNYPSFYWKVYQTLAVEARDQSCVLPFEVLTKEGEEALTLPLFTRDSKTDGLIVIGEISSRYLQFLKNETELPLVFVDFQKKGMSASAVLTNNFYGMYEMVNYLIENGHRDIAYVGTIRANNSIMDRYFGYLKALTEADIPACPEWVIKDRDETGYLTDIPLPERMPTAFACNSDLTASALIKILAGKGYRVPGDISVVGFDNYLYEGLCDIKITSYEVNVTEMVKAALTDIISQVREDGCVRTNGTEEETREAARQRVQIITGRLVVKDSVRVLSKQGDDGLALCDLHV